MRMRPHIHAGPEQEFGRTHLVEKNERPNHLSLPGRERPPHGKAAEVACARHSDHVDCVASERVAGLGIEGWLPTHVLRITDWAYQATAGKR